MFTGRRKITVLLVFILAASALVLWQRDLLVFGSSYHLDSPSDAYMDGNGNLYVIDRSKMDIVKANPDGTFAYVIKGGINNETGFYNVNDIAVSDDGRVFAHGLRFEGRSLYLTDERILEYSRDGRFVRELFGFTYDHSGLEPRQKGLIHGLCYVDGILRFAYCGDNAITIYEMEDGKDAVSTFEIPVSGAWKAVQDVCVSPDGQNAYYTNKLGELWSASVSGAEHLDTSLAVGGALESTPYRLALAAPNRLLFSDLGTWSIREMDLETGLSEMVFGAVDGAPVPDFEEREILYSVSASGDKVLITGDAVHITEPGKDGYDSVDSFTFTPGRMILTGILWLLSIASAGTGMVLLIKLVRFILICSSVVRLAAAVVVLTVIISFFISALVIRGMNENIENNNQQTILYIASFGASLTDGDRLLEISSNADFQSEDYNALKSALDNLQLQSDIYGLDFYYMLYRNEGDIALGVMDSEYLVSPAFPCVITPEFYFQAALEGKTVYGQTNDTTGMWGFALSPVLDSSGGTAGILEIGIDMNSHVQFLRGQIVNVILNVFAITVIFILLTIETATFAPLLKAREEASTSWDSVPYIARLLTFLLFMTHCLQDSFFPVIAMDAYEPVLGIPKSVGGALPIVVEMLAIALFSIVTGNLASRIHRRNLMISGAGLLAMGYIIIAINASFPVLMTGKLLSGIGLGISTAAINGAAAGLPENVREQAFDGISFGMISGIQVGIVVGSLIVGFSGYSIIFLISAAVSLMVLLLSALLVAPEKAVKALPGGKNTGLLRFLINPRTGGFLFLVLVPALTVATLIDYYLPIIASDFGLTEANVGQISLVYGVFVIFIGPVISPRLLGRIGTGRGIALAIATAASGIAAFAFRPGVPALLVMVLLYGVSLSFGMSARMSHFAALRDCNEFGPERAMGVYGMFENLTMSFAPMFIASVMAFGYNAGAGMIAVFAVGTFAIYFAVRNGGRKV